MTTPNDAADGVSSPPVAFPYEYRYRSVLWKSLDEVMVDAVAQRRGPDVTIWMYRDVRENTRYAYVLTDEGLAMFAIGEHDQSTRWSVGDTPIFYWPRASLPDAVSPSNLIDWGPIWPRGSEPCDNALSAKLRELLLPALIWWPELPYRGRALDAPAPSASKPRTVSYSRALGRHS